VQNDAEHGHLPLLDAEVEEAVSSSLRTGLKGMYVAALRGL